MTEDSVMEVDVGMALAMIEMDGVWCRLGFDGVEVKTKMKKKKKKKKKEKKKVKKKKKST